MKTSVLDQWVEEAGIEAARKELLALYDLIVADGKEGQ